MILNVILFVESWLVNMSLRRYSGTGARRSSCEESVKILDIKEYFKESKKMFFEEYNNSSAPTTNVRRFSPLYTLKKSDFGSTKLVQDKQTNDILAMKVLEKRKLVEKGLVKYALGEKKILQSINFPLAIRMEFFCVDYSWIYFVMPFLSGGDLRNLLRTRRRLSERLSCFYAAQIVLALEYLQNILFIHRDLKPGNILLDSHGYLKVADFGFAKMVESRTYTLCGTPPYMAPEVIEGNGYARSVDWWSLGVVIYEMVAGKPPFQAKNKTALFTTILYLSLDFPDHFSAGLQSILKKLLERDVARRLGNMKRGAEEVKSHEWFKDINWLLLLNKKATPLLSITKADFNLVSNFPKARKASILNVSTTDEFTDQFKDF